MARRYNRLNISWNIAKLEIYYLILYVYISEPEWIKFEYSNGYNANKEVQEAHQ